jgi:hypothetical protein
MSTKYDERVATLESNMQSVKADVGNLKADVSAIKTDLAKLQGSAGTIKWILGIFLPLIAIWMGTLSYSVFFQAGAASSKIVAELKSPKSPQQLQANLNTVVADIQTATANGNKPNEKKVAALSGALSQVVKKNPELPEAWRAVATLVSYRSSDVLRLHASMPDCDVSQEPRLIAESETPEIPYQQNAGRKGFLFRNCRLHLDRLPSGKVVTGRSTNGDKIFIGWVAFVIDCEIVLNDSGLEENGVEMFYFVNCQLKYQIERTPPALTQKLLLASLQPISPGRISVQLKDGSPEDSN